MGMELENNNIKKQRKRKQQKKKDIIGLSRERVRQVGLVALEKLKHAARKKKMEAMLSRKKKRNGHEFGSTCLPSLILATKIRSRSTRTETSSEFYIYYGLILAIMMWVLDIRFRFVKKGDYQSNPTLITPNLDHKLDTGLMLVQLWTKQKEKHKGFYF
ncbi:hypothetical protein QQP08_016114 [Theobroma cacao]|nr:hypothetical protein QQP08_016114 [Theobroma cacao]